MFDPRDPAFVADPYPAFAALRADGPVHWHPGLGMYVAVSHAACDAVLRDRGLGRVWRDRQPAADFAAFNLLHRTSMLESEPPTHTRLRRLVASAFGRSHVERLRPRVEALAAALVEDLADQIRDGAAPDLLAIVAQPLPIEVIAELLGVPEADRGLLRPWSNAIVKMYEYGVTPDLQRAAEEAAAEFTDYLRAVIARRRGGGGRDLVTDLIGAAAIEGSGNEGSGNEVRSREAFGSEVSSGQEGEVTSLSEDEIVGTCVLLLMAGHEATVNVIGNGVLALLRDPPQYRRVVRDPGLVAAAAEEMIRYDAPLQLFEREAARDVQIAGTLVRAGQKVAVLLGAGNRDPAVFAMPDRFDAGRAPNPHLGFGAGIHFCLGAPLARIEVRSVLVALTRALPKLVLAGEPSRRPEFVMRGVRELRVSTR